MSTALFVDMARDWPTLAVIVVLIAGAFLLSHLVAAADPSKIHANSCGEGKGSESDSCSVAAMRGRRSYMEDTHSFITQRRIGELTTSIYGVFDGHGGTFSSHYAKTSCLNTIATFVASELKAFKTGEASKESQTETTKKQEADGDTGSLTVEATKSLVSRAMTKAFLEIDQYILARDRESGSTGVVAAMIRSTTFSSLELVVANVGDSRGVLARRRKDGSTSSSDIESVSLSEDHKPNREDERARVTGVGGVVTRAWGGIWRVEGVLAVSRAFGDATLKSKGVSAEPEIKTFTITDADEFFVLATDGLWDVFTNDEAVQFIHSRLFSTDSTTHTTTTHTTTTPQSIQKRNAALKQAASDIVRAAYDKGSADNITALIVVPKWTQLARATHSSTTTHNTASTTPRQNSEL
eukprot:TRINITY_DN742_c0_g1_i2.p1 TRINITY_DN742_c0_g1~~TRINITY_DN742_c0_g1_i2.p1  ORF type:complete len:410 (-),score=79.08 TRINITY_DN742_c0_g1_i2:8-1237(-)